MGPTPEDLAARKVVNLNPGPRSKRTANGHAHRAGEQAGSDAEDTRPIVDLILGELSPAVAMSNSLLAERSGAMFVLGDVLVTLELVGGELQTVRATPTRIGLELSRVARYRRVVRVTDEGLEWRPCDPPMKLAAAIADEPGGWLVPRLAELTEVPILRPDGSVVTVPGYDRESRLFLHGGPFEPIPADPKAALAVLLEAINEFPFVEPHHRSAALALLLTSVIRRQLPAAPMFGISAREAGTGKGAMSQLGAIMQTGRRAPETPWPTSAEEQRKSITAALLRGRPTLMLDNINTVLDSTALCVLLTAETWADRILGASREVTLPAAVLMVATGNNLMVAGDLCRRVIPIEMDAGVENPELRTFVRDLGPWAIANRQKLVAAAIAILAAYRRADQPVKDGFAPLGSFEEWSRSVCGALTWLGQADPRDGMHATRASDPKRLLLSRTLSGMHGLFGETWQAAGSILDMAKTSERAPELRDAIEEITVKARDDKSAKIILGRWLEREKGRVVGGFRLEADRDAVRKVNLWLAVPTGSDGEFR